MNEARLVANEAGAKAGARCGLALIMLVAFAVAAPAQGRYRLVIGSPNTPRVTVAEFLPCVPAEGSGCGGWIAPKADSAYTPPAIATRAASADGRDSISIERGVVVLKWLVKPTRWRSQTLAAPSGAAEAVAVSEDSRYAFVAYDRNGGRSARVVMIDLSTRESVFVLPLSLDVAGIAAMP